MIMDTIILIIIATCVFMPYMIYQHYRRKKKQKTSGKTMKLHQVEAGPTRYLFRRKVDLTPLVDVDMENIKVNPNLQYFVVKNQCMRIKGIASGDIVGVRMFDSLDDMSVKTAPSSILLIYLDDKRFKGFKIREQGELTDDGTAYNTYHYKGGIRHKSTKPHPISSIKGVVEEVYQRNFVVPMD